MKIKSALLVISIGASLLFGSCQKDNPQKGAEVSEKARITAYNELHEKFLQDVILVDFSVSRTNIYRAKFSDGSEVLIDRTKVKLFICNPSSWPQIGVVDGYWTINGSSVNIPSTGVENQVVALFYDDKGLFARLQNGEALYFYKDGLHDVGFFMFEANRNINLQQDVCCNIENGIITAALPAGTRVSSMVATIAHRGSSILIDGKDINNGTTAIDCSKELSMEVKEEGESAKTFKIKITPYKRLPVLHITTEGKQSITSKENYVNAILKIENPDKLYTDKEYPELVTEIRGRGNSTWNMAKKPYKLKLDKKNRLFGMSDDKEWALLANYSDKTLLRNSVAFDISRILGMAWTPQGRAVEVYLNDEYQGQYSITEHVKISKERINIELIDENVTSGEELEGGYFFEIDERHDADTWFETAHGLDVTFKDPKLPNSEQLAYCKNYFKQIEDAMYSASFKDPEVGYAKYIDVKSLVHNYIIQELTKNVDGDMRLSTFFTKSRGGKLIASHVWDFDIALGNANYLPIAVGNGPNGFYIKNAIWYKQLFKDPAFVAMVKEEWNRLYQQLNSVFNMIHQSKLQFEDSQYRNFEKWNILNKIVWPNPVALGSYEAEVNYMSGFLNSRAEWLNKEINKL